MGQKKLVLADLPVDTRNVDNDIDHVTAYFVRLHVNRGIVRGNVNFADDVKEERFLNERILNRLVRS